MGTPALIRKSLQGGKFRRAGSPLTALPTTLEIVRGAFAISTNWSTFDRGMDLPKCETELHAPLLGPSSEWMAR